MRVAIYARVSTDEQAQSAEAQERDARRFCESRGWSVVEVYRDIGVSGAEWDSRPEIARARLDIEREPRPWDALVVRDLDRIGRDTARTLLFVEVVLAAGARVFEYSTGLEAKGDPMARATIALRGVFAEMERGMISARTRGSHESRARQGIVTGGTVFGYRNERRGPGEVARVIAPDEAAIVREIFERRAAGEGYRTIARDLNTRAIPSPHAGRRGSGSWAPSTLLAMLRRPLYRGIVEWGRMRKAYRLGTKVRTRQVDAELVTTEAPELRIIDDDLWARVRAQDGDARVAQGRPAKRGRAAYLMIGHMRCSSCGGPVAVRRGRWGATTVPVYACHWHRDRGDAVCAVASARPVSEVDRVISEWIRDEVLSPEVSRAVLARVRLEVEAMARADLDTAAVERVSAELLRVEGEASRLAAAVAKGGDLDVLLVELRQRQARTTGLRAELTRLRAPALDLVGLDWRIIEREASVRLAALAELFARDLGGAREVLAALLPTPLTFSPVKLPGYRGARWEVSGVAVTGGMFVSPAGPAHSRTLNGLEPRIEARLVA